MKKPCSCGFNYFFVRSTGDVFLCPLLDESIGNFVQEDIELLFRSSKARRIRKTIGNTPQCKSCTEPGLERYALPFEGYQYLKLMLQMKAGNFMDFHCHMGFDKYL